MTDDDPKNRPKQRVDIDLPTVDLSAFFERPTREELLRMYSNVSSSRSAVDAQVQSLEVAVNTAKPPSVITNESARLEALAIRELGVTLQAVVGDLKNAMSKSGADIERGLAAFTASSDRTARALVGATWALVFATLGIVVVELLKR